MVGTPAETGTEAKVDEQCRHDAADDPAKER